MPPREQENERERVRRIFTTRIIEPNSPELASEIMAKKTAEEIGPKIKPLTDDLFRQMRSANNELTRLLERPGGIRTGRRETEYNDLARSLRYRQREEREIVHDEIPTPFLNVHHRRLQKIYDLGIKGLIKKADSWINPYCATCMVDVPHEFAWFCLGSLYCSMHVPKTNVCVVCADLATKTKDIATYDNKIVKVCLYCIKNRRCINCEEDLPLPYIEARRCSECLDIVETRFPRPFNLGIKHVGKKVGQIVKTTRVFSCEIEALTPNPDWAGHLFKRLPASVGISRDGSIQPHKSDLTGYEIQTPRLAGDLGEELVRHTIPVLKEVDSVVNTSCGLHIHIDGAGLFLDDRRKYPTALLQLCRTYVAFEDVMLSLIQFSRRRNDYCRPLSESFTLNDFDLVDNLPELERLWYKETQYGDIVSAKKQHYHASRYFGANFHSLLAHGHFEVRYHGGTLNVKKILEWANLHALILDACANNKMDRDFIREANATYKIQEKTKMLFDRIGLSPSSQQWHFSRQNKFSDRKREDEEVIDLKLGTRLRPERARFVLPGSGPTRIRSGVDTTNGHAMFYSMTADEPLDIVRSQPSATSTPITPEEFDRAFERLRNDAVRDIEQLDTTEN
jgi:hypothetical protein